MQSVQVVKGLVQNLQQFLNYLNNGPLISDFVARIELKEILAPLVFK